MRNVEDDDDNMIMHSPNHDDLQLHNKILTAVHLDIKFFFCMAEHTSAQRSCCCSFFDTSTGLPNVFLRQPYLELGYMMLKPTRKKCAQGSFAFGMSFQLKYVLLIDLGPILHSIIFSFVILVYRFHSPHPGRLDCGAQGKVPVDRSIPTQWQSETDIAHIRYLFLITFVYPYIL